LENRLVDVGYAGANHVFAMQYFSQEQPAKWKII